jgi:uncharacterized protein
MVFEMETPAMTMPHLLISKSGRQVEENCACSENDTSLLPLLPVHHPIVRTKPGLYRDALPNHHTLIFDPLGASNVLVLDASALAVLDAFVVPRQIHDLPDVAGLSTAEVEDIVHQLLALGLLQSPEKEPSAQLGEPTTLIAWLHVTNACNLRCHYCYINKTEEAMSDITGYAAIDSVFRAAQQHGFRAVKLKYAGGEATLNFRLVRLLHQHAAAWAKRTGIVLHEVVLSNGVGLTTAMLQTLRATQMRLMISLDGIGAAHDRQRVFVNGRGSFAHVARAIDRALAQGVQPDLSITVTSHNADQLAAVITFALDRTLRCNLNFYREHDCKISAADLLADQQRMIAGMQAAFVVIEERLPQQRLIDGLIDRSAFGGPHEYACGAGHHYLVFDHQGGIARCQMEIERPVTSVLAADPLTEIRLYSDGFQNVPVRDKAECRTCTWRYWCAGGCSWLTYRTTGRSDIKSPYCQVYKALYPDLLRLEGLRLLKWGSDPSPG